jgi:hypothetical protein
MKLTETGQICHLLSLNFVQIYFISQTFVLYLKKLNLAKLSLKFNQIFPKFRCLVEKTEQ